MDKQAPKSQRTVLNAIAPYRFTLIALFSISLPLISLPQTLPTAAPQNYLQYAQFELPSPPDPGSPSGHGQGGGTRQQGSNQSGSFMV